MDTDEEIQKQLMTQFERINQTIREATVLAMDQNNFSRVHDLATLAENVKKLETKAATLLGEESSATETEPRDAGLPGDFPKYYRRGDSLVKEALRGDGVTTYEQRMPYDSFTAILKVLRQMAETRHEFRPTTVVEQADQPTYLVYLLLNVLLKLELLETPERGLYKFVRKDMDSWSDDLWARIPTESELTNEAN